jgi:regulator of sirC expression with transglutaminase-like and TPR domain
MSLSNIHSDLKAILEEAIAKKDYKKVMAILSKLMPSNFPEAKYEGIMFKDVKQIVKTREDLENILLSTKVVFENKDELLEFFEMLLNYGFKENAISYFEELIYHLNDIEIIDGFNSLLKK